MSTTTTIAKYIERFRYQEPLPADQRNLSSSEESKKAFWWLDDIRETRTAPSESDDLSDDGTVSTEDSLNRTSQTDCLARVDEQSDGLKFSYSNLFLLNSHEIDSERLLIEKPSMSSAVTSINPLISFDTLAQKLPLNELDHKAEALFQLCDRLLEDFQQSDIVIQPPQTISDSCNSHFLSTSAFEDENDYMDRSSVHSSVSFKDEYIDKLINQEGDLTPSSQMEVRLENFVATSPPQKIQSPKSEKIKASELSSSFYLSSDDEEMISTAESCLKEIEHVPRSPVPNEEKRSIQKNWNTLELREKYSSDDILQQLLQQYELKQMELHILREKLRELIP